MNYFETLTNLFTEETVVQVGDRVKVYSDSHGGFVEGTVKAPQNINGYWGVLYDDGSYRMKELRDSNIVKPEVREFTEEEVVKTVYEVVFPVGEPVEFDSLTDAGLYASGVKRGGTDVEIFAVTERIVKERKLVDSL